MSAQVRERVSRVEPGRDRGTRLPFGLNAVESIAALVAVAILVAAVVYYLTSLRPLQDQLRGLQTELDRQQKNMILSTKPSDAAQRSPDDIARDAIESLESFKNSHLKPFSSGRIELIKQINALAKKDNVTLTSGIDMGGTAEESDAAKSSDKTSGTQRNKTDEIFNAFPSVNFHFTVFGPYGSVRSFIDDLEHEKQFVVVRSVSLTNQEAKTNSRRARAEGISGIMLTIEMAAYFQP